MISKYLGMTNLSADIERELLLRSKVTLLRAWNSAGLGRPLLDVGDKYQLIQRIAGARGLAERILQSTTQQEPEEVKLSEIPLASMAELVAEYNKHSDKPVAGFRNRATAEERVASVLPQQRGRKPVNFTVKYVGKGRSNVRETSTRGKILAHIMEQGTITKNDLDRKFGINTAGYIGKLAEMDHVKVIGE